MNLATRLLGSTSGLLLALCAGCIQNPSISTEAKYQPVSVPLGAVQRAHIRLDLGAGQLTIRGGADNLIDGSLGYAAPAWQPEVQTSNSGDDETVTIKERAPGGFGFGHHNGYRWDLSLNNKPRMNLDINCGAGQARLELGDLNLEDIQVKMGAGQIDLDLRGQPSQSYNVHVSGGVGQANIKFPRSVGVLATPHGGIGNIQVIGLQKQGDHYENSLYGHSNVTVHVTVEGGIGQIRLLG
jgi:hypothetical protein